MPRWPQDARRRLVAAATELFVEHGYAGTTVDDIASRAGVSPRTFFRYFPDKEEVLFADDDLLLPVLLDAITAPGPAVTAERLMGEVLRALADVMEPDRERLRARHGLMGSQVALHGRDLAKQARWQQEIAGALRRRGFASPSSSLLAAIGFALFRETLDGWLVDDDPTPLAERVAAVLPSVPSVLDEMAPATTPSATDARSGSGR